MLEPPRKPAQPSDVGGATLVDICELGAAREALERSGYNVPDMARKQRDYLEALMRDSRP